MPQDSGLDISEHVCSLGIREDDEMVRFAGTGFGIQRRGLVLTASHVVRGATKPEEVYLKVKSRSFIQASHIEHHPEADIAALLFPADQAPSFLSLGEPPRGDPEFLLGTEVSSYGYPYRDEPNGRKTLEPRLMHGRIQRHFQHEWSNPRRLYHAFELSFPALPGQSGSPVFLDHAVDSVIAVLTENFESSVVIDSYEEHEGDGSRATHKISKIFSYGVGVRCGATTTGYETCKAAARTLWSIAAALGSPCCDSVDTARERTSALEIIQRLRLLIRRSTSFSQDRETPRLQHKSPMFVQRAGNRVVSHPSRRPAMGSSLEARCAGWKPKNRPAAAAVPRPLATDAPCPCTRGAASATDGTERRGTPDALSVPAREPSGHLPEPLLRWQFRPASRFR